MTNQAHTSNPSIGERPVTWALIGASSIAATYMIDAFRRAPGGRLAGVLSSDPERGARYAEQHQLACAYASLEELCASPEVDAVYISTPNDRHAPQALAAIEAGKHVLCEKPLAATVADARAMVAAAEPAGVTLGVNHHLRSAPANLMAKELIDSERIGTVLGARFFHGTELPVGLRTWRTGSPEAGAGAALDLTVHGADLLRFLLSGEIEEVAAFCAHQGMSTHPDIEDAVAGVLRLSGGQLVTFHDAFTTPYVHTRVEIYGSAGSITIEDAMLDDPVATVTLYDESGAHQIPLDQSEGLYVRTVRLFNEAVKGRGAPTASGEDGLRSLMVASAALQAAREMRTVRVELVA
ncbi:MAG TPA: Gfo/Idh/MocA family oxidoreductase [Solirubrobacteraceae bacterium]|jgi:1,5-anhydro-D-fructose reductase (1,5-anhydro-D-mannitol-forming)|nr:Gfo/Idh/MocA family oxidoreductase [Solirubrobacteraceae bacterium]